MGRWLRDVLVVATLLASAHAPMAAEQGTTASAIDVKVQNGLLTVNLRDAPLADVLLAIGEQAGFRVLVRGDAKTTVTRSFSDVPLAKGVQRLLEHASSWLMTLDGDALEEVRLYGWIGSPAVTSRTAQTALAVSLTDDHDTRLRFVKKIARHPHASATEGLILLVTGDRDPLIRRIAAIALGKVKGERSLVALASAAEDEDSSVRRWAIQGLGMIGGEQAVRTVGGALLEDPDPSIRRSAARTLATMRNDAGMDFLYAAELDHDPGVRQAVEAALSRLSR